MDENADREQIDDDSDDGVAKIISTADIEEEGRHHEPAEF